MLAYFVLGVSILSFCSAECVVDCVKASKLRFEASDDADACISFRKVSIMN